MPKAAATMQLSMKHLKKATCLNEAAVQNYIDLPLAAPVVYYIVVSRIVNNLQLIISLLQGEKE